MLDKASFIPVIGKCQRCHLWYTSKVLRNAKKEGASKEELKKLRRERSKLANKMDTSDDISHKYDVSNLEGYERKIDHNQPV
ncbi:hypothetical protein [Paenibacillus sp. AD87]|uniref:hypothetical protein n=1 Tax=Paenibacillus sp. AD87 TaxID=1528787 RepID=UPI0007E372F4|nr:hypothetical protein [Paenibacillus sp. AD87]